MDIKIKRLTNTATLPTKAHSTDACFDIYADCPDEKYTVFKKDINATDLVSSMLGADVAITESGLGIAIEPGKSATIHAGFATDIPEGYFAAVYPRSGMGIKRHLRLSNSTGVIDSSYRGEWMVALHNDGDETQIIHHGDRIAQFAILPVLDITLNEVNELNETERGQGGFGSSGN